MGDSLSYLDNLLVVYLRGIFIDLTYVRLHVVFFTPLEMLFRAVARIFLEVRTFLKIPHRSTPKSQIFFR